MTDPKAVMLKSVRNHSRLVRERVEARNVAIRGARIEGASLREIAEAAQLTHTGIKRIIDR